MPEELTVLIVGKGPSVREVKREDPRIICALNGACRLCGRIDWLFLNDVSAIKEITESCIGVTENLVVPSELHLDTRGRRTLPFDQLPNWLVEDPCLFIYQLPSAKKKREDIPDFGQILSVGETAIAWMLEEGFRNFETIGIDPEGGYHDIFAGCAQDLTKPRAWYRRNWRRMAERVEAAGGTIRQISFGE